MDIGNMHRSLVKIACVVPEISLWTDRQTYSSQYLATVPAGEVNITRQNQIHAYITLTRQTGGQCSLPSCALTACSCRQ